MIRIAAWQYPIEQLASFDAWRDKLAAGIGHAASQGAELVIVPEYASMELTALDLAPTLVEQVDAMQALLPDYLATYANLATKHGLAIVGGSFPERTPEGVINRARIHAGTASIVVDKLQMTRFEAESWNVIAGHGQTVVELRSSAGTFKLGVAICYDSEFPLLVRRLAEAGADIIAVPSCTDTDAGYHRVRTSCRARALENQCYVIQVPTVGMAPWSIALDANIGAAGVFAPPDVGFPSDGVVATGTYNEPGWLVADLDLAALAEVRKSGHVFNDRDWARPNHLAGNVTVAALSTSSRS